ncbi:alkaline phosphatase family protein [Pedobacter panaciterrae]
MLNWRSLLFIALATSISIADAAGQSLKPKIVVGIVVEQMKFEYLSRFYGKFGENGFKRLINNGYNCNFTHINSIPTSTSSGYASIYTGATPSIHGIVNNDWYDKRKSIQVYSVEDPQSTTLGSSSFAGHMSPIKLRVPTIGDELRLYSNFQSKVFAIGLKDRGAILSSGHSANAAYFFDSTVNKWVSSTYYLRDLPDWVKKLNDSIDEKYLVDTLWKTLLPIEEYTESGADDSFYEGRMPNEAKPIFPHVYTSKKTMFRISTSPTGNLMTLDLAKEVIVNEKLGSSNYTDMLNISLSSTDYIGHMYGPRSVEIEDCYLRLDQQLASFLAFLDNKIGKNNYIFYLTSTHGVADNVQYLSSNKLPYVYESTSQLIKEVEKELKGEFGDFNWIKAYSNPMIFLNDSTLAYTKADKQRVKNRVISLLSAYNGIYKVIDLANTDKEVMDKNLLTLAVNGCFPNLMGDLMIISNVGWSDGPRTGTTHGSGYAYDTHVPLIWYGQNIQRGVDMSSISITDIAPTLSAILGIQEPSGSNGKVISGLFKRKE